MRQRDIRPPIPADPYATPSDNGSADPAGTFDYCDHCCKYRMRPGSSYCSTACETAAKAAGDTT
jgi:hypothetical protein